MTMTTVILHLMKPSSGTGTSQLPTTASLILQADAQNYHKYSLQFTAFYSEPPIIMLMMCYNESTEKQTQTLNFL